MTAPERPLKPRPRGQVRTDRMLWHDPRGADFHFDVSVRFREALDRVSLLGVPQEIWIKALKGAGRTGTALETHADDAGEVLSLLLQHGHAIADLQKRFKPGGLMRKTIERAWQIAVDEGADVPELPDELVVSGATEVTG